jgi:lipopolysaccharide exporter
MALAFPLNALGMTHSALLQKELSFKRRFIPDVIAMVVKSILSIGLALAGFGLWSLVIGYLSSSVVMGVGVWFVHSWRPNFRFYMDKAREMWQYGMHIFMLNILSIAVTQFAPLLIGRLGATELGYFSIASRIPDLILLNIGNILTRVIFPTYVKIKDDRVMLTQSFFATTKYTAFITVAVGLGLSAIAPEIVSIFGYKWEPAIPIARVLPLVAMTLTLAWNAGDVFKAIGRPDVSTKLLMIETVYIFGFIFLAIHFWQSALAVAWANLLAYIISATLRMLLIRHFLKFNFLKFLEVFRGPFIAGGAMYLAIAFWRSEVTLPLIAMLVSSVLIGAVVYIAVLYLTDRKDVTAAYKLIMGLIRRTPPQPTPTVDVYTAVNTAE